VVGLWHFKGMFSYAFRAPTINNLSNNPDITRELTRATELEVGYTSTRNMGVTLSLFDLYIADPIVYIFDPVESVAKYQNQGQTGTLGGELEYRYQSRNWNLRASYSLYHNPDRNRVETYSIPGETARLLGSASHKIALSATVPVYRKLHFNLSGQVLSPRVAIYRYDDETEEYLYKEQPWSVLINANLFYSDLAIPGLDVNLSVHHLTNQPYQALQPYNGGYAPLPLGGIEVGLRVAYRWNRNQ
jgi:outer membrane cobalamin receptor